MVDSKNEIHIVIRMIDAVTGEPFSFDKMFADMVEKARQRLLSEGKTTWPNGKPLKGDDDA